MSDADFHVDRLKAETLEQMQIASQSFVTLALQILRRDDRALATRSAHQWNNWRAGCLDGGMRCATPHKTRSTL